MKRKTVGPHDLRKRRTRCRQCALKHLKCCGKRPCSQCSTRGIICQWDNEIRKAEALFVQVHRSATFVEAPAPRPRASTEDLWSQYLIKHIGPLVTFSGASTPLHDMKPLLSLSPALRSASAAVGAMFCVRGPRASDAASIESRAAFEAYAVAVMETRAAIAQLDTLARLPTLWAVFLLSLFELMADVTGENWIKHTLFGISRLLEAIGPLAMLQSEYQAFFMELRIFEVSRALITTTRSILARQEWRVTRASMNTESHVSQKLVDVMIDAADLGWRATKMISLPDFRKDPNAAVLRSFAEEATMLHIALEDQRQTCIDCSQLTESQQCFQRIQYAAISIYLSGIFDYHQELWERHCIPVPTLQPTQVQLYVETILANVQRALELSELSGIPFVFALRVAGARSQTAVEQERVMTLLRRIERCYVGAHALVVDLQQLWTGRSTS